MLSLEDLEIAFQNFLLTDDPTIKNEIHTTQHFSVSDRLNIYRNAYYLRLIESLQLDYEMLHTILGDESFDELARQYIHTYPSTYRSISALGGNLPEFIKINVTHPLKEFFFELATFEWLLVESFGAKNNDLLNLDEISTIPAEEWPFLCFSLHPSVRILNSRWNILQIWNAIHVTNEMIVPQKLSSQISIIIWRKELDTQFYSLTHEKNLMLTLIQEHQHFGTICEKLCEYHHENQVGLIAAQLLKDLMIDGIITRVIFEKH